MLLPIPRPKRSDRNSSVLDPAISLPPRVTRPNLKPFTDLLGVDAATLKKELSGWGPVVHRCSFGSRKRGGLIGLDSRPDIVAFRTRNHQSLNAANKKRDSGQITVFVPRPTE